MQSELKPCPFCGWATGLSVFDSGELPYWVECPDCCAQGAPEGTKVEAITAWNTRASDAEITRLTEALRAAEEREKGLREALGEICRDSNPDWTERRVYPDDTLDDIHKIAVEAFYGVKI